jgi:aminoglycoside phosphotransferase (APT) family kinase protein
MKRRADPGESSRLAEALTRLRAEIPAVFGTGGPGIITVKRLLRRPHSTIVWIDVESNGARRACIVKLPLPAAPGDARRAEKIRARLLADRDNSMRVAELLAGAGNVPAVRPITCYPDVPALVTEVFPGENLSDLLARRGAGRPSATELHRLETAFYAAGAWARAFQERTAVPAGRFSLEAMCAYVDIRLRRLEEAPAAKLDSETRRRILRQFDRAQHEAPEESLHVAAIHGDFALSNILWDGAHIAVVDFSTMGLGSVFHDLTRVHHQLGLFLRKPSHASRTTEAVRRAFWQGCGRSPDETNPVIALHLLQHVVTHWLGHLKERRGPVANLYAAWVRHHHRREVFRLLDLLERNAL